MAKNEIRKHVFQASTNPGFQVQKISVLPGHPGPRKPG